MHIICEKYEHIFKNNLEDELLSNNDLMLNLHVLILMMKKKNIHFYSFTQIKTIKRLWVTACEKIGKKY